jgi:hypothetical protein
MTSFQKRLFGGLGVVLMMSSIPFQAMAERGSFTGNGRGAIETIVNPGGDSTASQDELSNLAGFTSDGNDPDICFDATATNSFNPGDSVRFNVFWIDTVEDDQVNQYLVRVDLRASDGTEVFTLRRRAEYSLSQAPGTVIQFCFAIPATLPTDILQGTYPWGGRVRKLDDFTRVQDEELHHITVTVP